MTPLLVYEMLIMLLLQLTLAVPAGVISDPILKNLKICLKYFVVCHFLAATYIPYE